MFWLFRLLPPRVASWLGGMIGRRLAIPSYPPFVTHVRANLARLRPELDAAAREKLLQDYFDNRGRVLAEFAALRALDRQGRLHCHGGEVLTSLAAQGKGVVALGLHLANWEIGSPVVRDLGLALSSIHEPPMRPVQYHYARKVRREMGYVMLPPGASAVRPALRFLQQGGVLAVYGDEVRQGRMMAPFWGRPPHTDGNLAVAVRLARASGAPMVVYYCTRSGTDHDLFISGPLALPSATNPGASLLDDVMALNALIEPIVREHIGSWFWVGAQF